MILNLYPRIRSNRLFPFICIFQQGVLSPNYLSTIVDKIMEALDFFIERQRLENALAKRVMIEYVLIAGVNDSDEVAHELGDLLSNRHILCNVIPYNVTDVPHDYKSPSREVTDRFNDLVRQHGVRCIQRQELGSDIDSACGQLVVREMKADSGRNLGDLEDLCSRKSEQPVGDVRQRKGANNRSKSPARVVASAPVISSTVAQHDNCEGGFTSGLLMFCVTCMVFLVLRHLSRGGDFL